MTMKKVKVNFVNILMVCLCSSVWDTVKNATSSVWEGFKYAVSCISPSNIREKYQLIQTMTYKERVKAFVKLNVRGFLAIITFLFMFVW